MIAADIMKIGIESVWYAGDYIEKILCVRG
jgi:hypothetical protein